MKYVILIFGLYIFITLIVMGISLMLNSEFIQDVALLLWSGFPFVVVIALVIILIL